MDKKDNWPHWLPRGRESLSLTAEAYNYLIGGNPAYRKQIFVRRHSNGADNYFWLGSQSELAEVTKYLDTV